jgi:hypothetical protein
MGFDQEDGIPSVNVHKRTTQVNLWMIVGLVTFLLVGAIAAIGLA